MTSWLITGKCAIGTLPQIYKNMGIIKADFDWISLLVIAVAGIIGMIKSGTKKTPDRPVNIPREYVPEMQEEETVEWFNDRDMNRKNPFQEEVEEIMIQGDYYKQPEEHTEANDPLDTFIPEQENLENEELAHFNLRQAIISSEILRRPEY